MLIKMQVSFLSLCQQIDCWPEEPGLGIIPEQLNLPQTPCVTTPAQIPVFDLKLS